ncbi:MAG: NHLP leader peptide family RiPP precursor [Cyanobacteria bacterium P01_A01_bin.83]
MSEQQTRKEFEANLISKAWGDESFKQELMNNPRAVYEQELGRKAPENQKIQVLEETPGTTYLVIPQKPETSEELSEEALESVAGGGGFGFQLGVFGASW